MATKKQKTAKGTSIVALQDIIDYDDSGPRSNGVIYNCGYKTTVVSAGEIGEILHVYSDGYLCYFPERKATIVLGNSEVAAADFVHTGDQNF